MVCFNFSCFTETIYDFDNELKITEYSTSKLTIEDYEKAIPYINTFLNNPKHPKNTYQEIKKCLNNYMNFNGNKKFSNKEVEKIIDKME